MHTIIKATYVSECTNTFDYKIWDRFKELFIFFCMFFSVCLNITKITNKKITNKNKTWSYLNLIEFKYDIKNTKEEST